jgi:cell division protein FtsL
MVVENRKNVVSGNTALASQVNPLPRERVKSPIKQGPSKEELKRIRKQRISKFLKLNGSIVAVGIVGSVIIFRYSTIYHNQKEIIALQEEIQTVTEKSEDLSINLLKFNNISYIEEVATKELKMIEPKSTNAIYCNINSIEEIATSSANEEKGDSLLSKIKNLLFN